MASIDEKVPPSVGLKVFIQPTLAPLSTDTASVIEVIGVAVGKVVPGRFVVTPICAFVARS